MRVLVVGEREVGSASGKRCTSRGGTAANACSSRRITCPFQCSARVVGGSTLGPVLDDWLLYRMGVRGGRQVVLLVEYLLAPTWAESAAFLAGVSWLF